MSVPSFQETRRRRHQTPWLLQSLLLQLAWGKLCNQQRHEAWGVQIPTRPKSCCRPPSGALLPGTQLLFWTHSLGKIGSNMVVGYQVLGSGGLLGSQITFPLRHCFQNFWVAVKELNLSYKNVDTWQVIWFWDYGNLIEIP